MKADLTASPTSDAARPAMQTKLEDNQRPHLTLRTLTRDTQDPSTTMTNDKKRQYPISCIF